LIEECNITPEQLGEKVGKNRTTVTNFLRLLKLPPEIQTAVRERKITMGQARPLVNINDLDIQLALLNEILEDKLSSREVEKRVKEINKPLQEEDNKEDVAKEKTPLPIRFSAIKEDLTTQLNTEVKLNRNKKGKGNIVITFKSDSDLERILNLLHK